MILKQADDRSRDIEELKQLKKTAPARYHADIQREIDNIYAGMQGENNAAHFINREFRERKTLVLHDLRLGIDGDFAQIDHLLISRLLREAWVLETKNYSGRLSCDAHGDWTVWYGSKPQPVASPVNQARRHCTILRQWLKQNNISTIETITPVVLISPSSSVARKHLPDDVHVIKSDNFPGWFDKRIDDVGSAELLFRFGKTWLGSTTQDDFIVLGKRLAMEHIPASFDWRAKLRLPAADEAPAATPAQAPAPASIQTPACVGDTIVERALSAQNIETPYGLITVRRLPDGRIAVKNEKRDELIDRVKRACKAASGQWNPRFSNWIISEEHLGSVLQAVA